MLQDTLDLQALSVALGLFVPLVVQLLSKLHASEGLKSVLNLVVSALVTVMSLVITSTDHINLRTVIITFVNVFVSSLVAYKGFYKPTGIAGSIASATANIGIGSPPELETEDKGAEDTF